MRLYKTIIPAVASVMLLAGCDDQIMQWGRGEGQGNVTSTELPLAVKEVIANYEDIKTYTAQYMPNTVVGIGMGAPMYVANENGEADLANANFQMFTAGNAMKHDAIVGNSGSLSFANVDALVSALQQAGMKLYGHNFFWHTQQQQTYLKSLIAPTLVVESEGDIANVLAGDATDFNGGTAGGWGSWGSNKDNAEVVEGVGQDGSAAMVLTNKGDGNSWEAQCAYTFDSYLETGKTYVIRFKAKSNTAAGYLQFQYQNSTSYGSQGAYTDFAVGTDWVTCEREFEVAFDDVDRIIINYGKVGGSYIIDDIQFGLKQEDPMDNVIAGDSYDFEGGTTGGWGSWGSNKESAEVVEGEGYQGSFGLVLKNMGDGNAWEAQNAYTFDYYLDPTKKYIIQFYAKSSSAAGEIQFQYQNGTSYGSQGGYNTFAVGTDWVKCEYEFTPAYEDVNRIIMNFGKVGATYYIDNVKFGVAKNQGEAEGAASRQTILRRASSRASKMYYVLKSADEKREALEGAMETWVKGMADHLAELGVVPYGYDVINEPISDGGGVRGYDGVFGGSWAEDDVTYYDAAPEENTTDGLNLNWGSGHWYWGYYVPDYPVKAFQLARKYLPAETKLFVNDYNLETSPGKLQQLCDFVAKIDADNGSAIVDGIGTQMHISLSCSDDAVKNAENIAALKEKVDAMFKTMAATGKLVRVTELDIALGTGSPSSAQYQAQADCYRMIVESFKANVPEAQQSGITIWSLSDNAAEHEYWLNGDVPNLFDADYLRKWAYKGFCDGIAGEDLGLKYGGEDYKAFYEKNNVSSTVK